MRRDTHTHAHIYTHAHTEYAECAARLLVAAVLLVTSPNRYVKTPSSLARI